MQAHHGALDSHLKVGSLRMFAGGAVLPGMLPGAMEVEEDEDEDEDEDEEEEDEEEDEDEDEDEDEVDEERAGAATAGRGSRGRGVYRGASSGHGRARGRSSSKAAANVAAKSANRKAYALPTLAQAEAVAKWRRLAIAQALSALPSLPDLMPILPVSTSPPAPSLPALPAVPILRVCVSTSRDTAPPSEPLSIGAYTAYRAAHTSETTHLCNCGASVWGVAWLPEPAAGAAASGAAVDGRRDAMVLAVGTYRDGASHALTSGINAIQFWKVPADTADPEPRARPWLHVLHNGGGVTALCWCPNGNACTAQRPSDQRGGTSSASGGGGGGGGDGSSGAGTTTGAPGSGGAGNSSISTAMVVAGADGADGAATPVDRLGLLAAACADGRVRIFAIPTPAGVRPLASTAAATAAAAATATAAAPLLGELPLPPPELWLPPVLQLEPRELVLPLTLDWCAGSPHLLATGHSDGTVKVWHLLETPTRAGEKTPWEILGIDLVQSIRRVDPQAGPNEEDEEGEEGEEASASADVAMEVDGVAAPSKVRIGKAVVVAATDGGSDRGASASAALPPPPGTPLGLLTVPFCVLGISTRLGGAPHGGLHPAYLKGSAASTQAIGHAGPVRSVRWAPAPHEYLASVGHDGLLMLWDHRLRVPMVRRHEVAPYMWALDCAWSAVLPLIWVAVDEPVLRLQPLRDDVEAAVRRREIAKIRPLSDAASNAAVWALALSAPGDRLAAATSAGRLEVHSECRLRGSRKVEAQVRGHVQLGWSDGKTAPAKPRTVASRAAAATPAAAVSGSRARGTEDEVLLAEDEVPDHAEGAAAAAAAAGTDAAPPAAGPILTVALGAAAAPPPPAPNGTPVAPSVVSLRSLQWNPNPAHHDWIACGGASGLLILRHLPTSRQKVPSSDVGFEVPDDKPLAPGASSAASSALEDEDEGDDVPKDELGDTEPEELGESEPEEAEQRAKLAGSKAKAASSAGAAPSGAGAAEALLLKRPKGRAPKGKQWDPRLGWIDEAL